MFGRTFSIGQAVIPRGLMMPPVGAPARKGLIIQEKIASELFDQFRVKERFTGIK